MATASPGKFDYVRGLGASEVVDYRDQHAVSKLKALGPYKFVMTASGDVAGAHAISDILQPEGGVFVSTRPQSKEMDLPDNVRLIYDFYSMATQKPENAAFSKWWYEDYLPASIAGGVTPTPLDKRSGGLSGIQNACEEVLGRAGKKLILDPQDEV